MTPHFSKRCTLIVCFLFSVLHGQEIGVSQRTADSLYADSLYIAGKNYYKLDDGGNAVLHLEKALELFEAGRFTKQIGVANNRLALTYFWLFGDWKKAEKHWLKTLEIREGLKDSIGIARAKHYLGNVYTKMDGYKKAESFI
jgi:tetratricopeptide (TPR) repeat protein